MRCATCGLENGASARFCSGCGASLIGSVSCRSCGEDNRPDQRFCGSCGHQLCSEPRSAADSRAASGARAHRPATVAGQLAVVEGERKVVTVLFADVKGSMDLSGSVDVERWWTIMNELFGLLCDGVNRYEGRVDRFTGDGMMAVFGAPFAYEDHARRACHAALWLRQRLLEYSADLRRAQGLEFSVRMGLNSGDVVVGPIGEDDSVEYTVVGRAAGLAQRMEAMAAPDSVYMTESTANLARGFFTLAERGTFAVKGVSEPVRVHELVDVGDFRSSLDVARSRGFSRFVGRAAELSALNDALDRVRGGRVRS